MTTEPADRPSVELADKALLDQLPPIVVAMLLRPDGITGVQSYVRRLRSYLADTGVATTLLTPFSWGRILTVPVFGARRVVERFSRSAGTVWYRDWHEAFLRRALRRQLTGLGPCIVYAQDPLAARAALRARTGTHQRVVLAVHFRISQADEWADKEEIKRGGMVFRSIRQVERDVIPRVDGLVYVSNWARDALLDWLPEAADVPSVVIGCVVTPLRGESVPGRRGDLVSIGNLDIVKNHRFLLEVLAEAKRAGHTYTLDVFGTGPLDQELRRQAETLEVADLVNFNGFQPDARRFLRGYRAYVHACYSESFCLAIVEAMEAGLPILAGDIGPLSELYDDGVEGRFWPLDDPASAAAMLMDLMDSEAARDRSAAAAAERFRREFDADHIVPRLLSFLAQRATPITGHPPATAPEAAGTVAGRPKDA